MYLHRVIEKKTIVIGGKVKNIFDYNAIMNRHGDANRFWHFEQYFYNGCNHILGHCQWFWNS